MSADARAPSLPPDRQPPTEPRERLVVACIGEIERVGLPNLTVRGIAKAADMNVASVNYHFGSKATLVEAALSGAITHLVEDLEAYLDALPDAPTEALTGLLQHILEGALRYPRLSKAHLHDAFSADDYSGQFPTSFAPIATRLCEALPTVVPALDAAQARHRVIAALSAAFFPAFFGGLLAPLDALTTPAQRADYVAEVVARTLATPAAEQGRRA